MAFCVESQITKEPPYVKKGWFSYFKGALELPHFEIGAYIANYGQWL